MDIYDKHAEKWQQHMMIDKGTWELLRDYALKFGVRSCLEFGCGLSTMLLDSMGIEVTAFEDKPEYVHPSLKHLGQSAVILYDDLSELKIDSHYDMAFIDGPEGGWNRLEAYELVGKLRIPLIVCHDLWRPAERKLTRRFLYDWTIIGYYLDAKENIATIALRLGDKENGNTNETEKSG